MPEIEPLQASELNAQQLLLKKRQFCSRFRERFLDDGRINRGFMGRADYQGFMRILMIKTE